MDAVGDESKRDAARHSTEAGGNLLAVEVDRRAIEEVATKGHKDCRQDKGMAVEGSN